MNIHGSVVVVTGGANGIGAAMARRFAAEGAHGIVIADLDEAKAAAVATEVDRAGSSGLAIRCDVAGEDQVRALVAAALERFDLAALLDGELSIEAWPSLSVARQRFLLSLAVHQVWAYSVDVPPQDRVVLVAHGEQSPEPRRGHEDVPPDDGRLAVLFHHRGPRGTRSVRYCIVHRRGCKRLPYPPGDARWEAAYEGPGRIVLAQPAEVPRLTAGHPVRVCGDCRIESPTMSQAE